MAFQVESLHDERCRARPVPRSLVTMVAGFIDFDRLLMPAVEPCGFALQVSPTSTAELSPITIMIRVALGPCLAGEGFSNHSGW